MSLRTLHIHASRGGGLQWTSVTSHIAKKWALCRRHYNRWWHSGQLEIPARRESCLGCDAVFVFDATHKGRANRTWCSEACRVRGYYRLNRQKISDQAKAQYIPAKRKPCANCGELAVKNRSDFRYCGKPECKRRAARERAGKTVQARRARLAGVPSESFLPREVFARDGWVCGICDLGVDESLRFPDPGSPSLDHIIPLSKGGPHTRENTRLAHLYCNLCKGARADVA